MNPLAPIGVFDSGIGGLSVLRALRLELPHEHFVYWADTAHAPYGERGASHALQRSEHIGEHLRGQHGIKALVIACNTATAAAAQALRAQHPDLPIIGLEPAIKPALAATRTGHIGVMATRGTLASDKFQALLAGLLAQVPGHCANVQRRAVSLQACDGLAHAIESHDDAHIRTLCAQHLRALGRLGTSPGEIDTVVLGCTHYPLALHHLRAAAGPDVQFIDSGDAVARHTRSSLAQIGALRPAGESGPPGITWLGSGPPDQLHAAQRRWLPHEAGT